MKKYVFYFALTFALTFSFSFLSIGQNLVTNGDLETWTAGEPNGWNLIQNISQESTTVHGGNYSAKHTSGEGGAKHFEQIVSGIQAGQEYTISYWYYDDDSEAKTRIWSYWLSGTSTLSDDQPILRPAEYSEDNPNWQEFNAVLTAPAGADGFRFHVRVYHQDDLVGGSVFYDDFSISGDVAVDPEPSEYPEDFELYAATNTTTIDVFWSDSEGSQLPTAYVIYASTNPSLPVPEDGIPIADDTDFSDGMGALNILYGMEECSFSYLDPNTTYYFSIYPYTNGGALIDFKNDGTAPTANAVTANITFIESENFDISWGNWTTISVTGTQVWDRDNDFGVGNTPCASMTGYEGQPYENDDWLISPPLNLDDFESEVLVFYSALGFTGPDLELKISTDYDGGGDPSSATWTDESFTFSTGYFDWTSSGDIDLSGYDGDAVYVAFRFTSSNAESATWEVDNILISGIGDVVILPEPSNYPTDFAASASGSSINLTWTDAIGTQLPGAYIIYAGTSASLPSPTDGTPVPNDPDLSDGSGTINVVYGLEETMFSNLVQGTTYYFSIYPYTNNGVDIDFKNDGTAPTANEIIPLIPEPTNYPTNFAADATTSSISLMWTDATGAQLPEAYIIYAGTAAILPSPTDGTPVSDDTDLSDGSGALNVVFGEEAAMFANLEQGTTYYFSIYPYTNGGANIDYKNDGTAPTADATTEESTSIVIESENFDESWGNWIIKNVVGVNEWDRDNTYGIGSSPCAQMSGHLGNEVYEDSDDWLISPELDLSNFINVEFTFWTATGYDGNELQVKVSEDYDGESDPNIANWADLEATLATNEVFWDWTFSGIVDLAMYSGSTIHLAFLYTSTTEVAATWEVDDILITGEEELSSDNQLYADDLFNIYPNPTTGLVYIEKPGVEFSNINIVSVTGNQVKSVTSSTELTKIDLSELNKGIYFIMFNNAETGQTITRKLILH